MSEPKGPEELYVVLRGTAHFTVDEDGDLYFVDRSDDIIKTRGEKVRPPSVSW